MYLSRLFRSVNPAALNQASAVGFNRVARLSSSRYFNYADDSGVSSKMEEANVQHQQRASQRAGVGTGSGETLRPNEASYASQGQNVGKGGNLSTNPNYRMGGSELGGPKYGESFSSTVGMDPHYDKSNSALDNAPNHGNSRTMSREASQDFGSKRSAQFSNSASVDQGGSVEGVLEEHNRREGFRPRGAEAHGDQNMANPTPATNDMRSNVARRQQKEDQKPLTGNHQVNNSAPASSFSSDQDNQQMGKDRHAWGENEPARDYHFYDSSSAPKFDQQSSSSSSSSSSVDASSLAAKVVNVVEGAKDIAVDMAKDAKELAKDAWQAVNRSAHENQSLLTGTPLVHKKYEQGAQAREGQHQQQSESFIERAKEAWHTLKGDNQAHASSQQNFSGNQQGRYQNQQYQQHGEGMAERTKEAWETLKGDNQQYRGQQDEGLVDRAKEAWETLKGDNQPSSSNFRNDRMGVPNDYIKTTGERAKEGMQKIKDDAKEMLEKSKEAFQNEDVADRAKEAWATLKGEGGHQNDSLKERAKDAWETIKDGSKSEQYKSKDFSASSSSSSSGFSSQGYNKDNNMMKGEGKSEEDLTERAKEAWKTIRGEDKDKASFSQKKDYSQGSKSSKDFEKQSSFQDKDKDKMENRSFEEKGSRGYLGSSGDFSNQSKQSQGSRITADKEKIDDLAYSIPELKKTTEAWKEEVRKALGEKEKKSKDSDSSFQESEARGYGGSLGEVAGQKDSKKYSEASDKKIPERHSNKKDSKAEQDKSSSSSAKRKAV